MDAIASQITSLTIVYSIVYSDADQRKHQSSASLAFVRRIHRGPVNSPHKWPVTRKMFPFDDVIMCCRNAYRNLSLNLQLLEDWIYFFQSYPNFPWMTKNSRCYSWAKNKAHFCPAEIGRNEKQYSACLHSLVVQLNIKSYACWALGILGHHTIVFVRTVCLTKLSQFCRNLSVRCYRQYAHTG